MLCRMLFPVLAICSYAMNAPANEQEAYIRHIYSMTQNRNAGLSSSVAEVCSENGFTNPTSSSIENLNKLFLGALEAKGEVVVSCAVLILKMSKLKVYVKQVVGDSGQNERFDEYVFQIALALADGFCEEIKRDHSASLNTVLGELQRVFPGVSKQKAHDLGQPSGGGDPNASQSNKNQSQADKDNKGDKKGKQPSDDGCCSCWVVITTVGVSIVVIGGGVLVYFKFIRKSSI